MPGQSTDDDHLQPAWHPASGSSPGPRSNSAGGRIESSLDYDPAIVPIQPAATVMLIDDRPDLHVLMVHRTAEVVFAPDSWVFPGGRVDPEDHIDDFDTLFHGLSDAEASAILGVERGGLAWWLAACRETLEEAGVLLAAAHTEPGTGGRPGVGPTTVAQLRARLAEDESLFADLLLEHGISLDATLVEEVARFITPMGPPRRFDARFFVARAPAGQEASHDRGEIVNTEWVQPSAALERWSAGEMEMMSPTVRMVACLTRYRSADEVMTAASRRLDYQRVRVADPAGAYQVLLPGEPGYEQAELE
ncbi:MAG: NUDIX domain-containing protein, partial [Acidimicrobiia bacterium]|nr:NUDIX domain-containing protein [Acidimicrobiia bacterium]